MSAWTCAAHTPKLCLCPRPLPADYRVPDRPIDLIREMWEWADLRDDCPEDPE